MAKKTKFREKHRFKSFILPTLGRQKIGIAKVSKQLHQYFMKLQEKMAKYFSGLFK
jgi:hypothetical protein